MFGAASGRPLRLLVLTRLVVRVLRCGGADWCGLVLGRVESWVRALGFPPFSLSPDPPDLLDARHKGYLEDKDRGQLLVAYF